MKRLLALLLTLTMMLGILVGCAASGKTDEAATEQQSSAVGSEKTEETKAYKIGLTWEMATELFAECIKIMQKYCDEKGIELVAIDSADVTTRVAAIENLVTAGCNAIIVHINDPVALEAPLKAAREAGVKIFCYDSDIESVSDAYYGCENHDYGYQIALNACNWINKNYASDEEVQVAITCKDIRDFLVIRKGGIYDCLAENCPNAKVVIECTATNAADGVTAGETILSAYPEVKVVIGVNDGGPLGCAEAYTAAGIDPEGIGMFGGDASTAALEAIAAGGMFRGTVSTHMKDVVNSWIDICCQLIDGEQMETTKFYFPMTGITEDNLSEFYQG